jgi:SAM-dependent methyltransferase
VAEVDRQGWDDRYDGEELIFTADPSRFLGPELAGLTPGRALDLGSGEGRNALWLAEQGWAVTGVDFSSVGIAKADRLARQRGLAVDWVVADLRSFQPPASTFDLVIQFFMHFPAPERRALLRRAVDALRPGGVILVVGYHVDHLDEGSGGGPQDPALLFTVDGLVSDLPDLRFDRVGRLRVPAGVHGDGTQRYAVNVVVRAARDGRRQSRVPAVAIVEASKE